ncbi:unnamed protein product [marine sediment metagenome]|uniref:Uncharacterized protein n=1 Tax=marine sediment metagenome TaxID=412755 RepID=X1V4H6_9ZZZZ
MRTNIITAHEEVYSNKSRTLGVLLIVDENGKRVDSLTYIYHNNTYIFFNTIIEMSDYLLYGDGKTKRAYMKEDDFDVYYETDYIEGTFTDVLKWSN